MAREQTHPLQDSNFRALLLTRLCSNLAVGFFHVPIMWWVLERTNSGPAIALVGLISALVGLVAAPIGGVTADRGRRRPLIQATYLMDAALLVVMAGLILTHVMKVGWVYPLLAATSFVASLRSPALASLVPLIIPRAQYQQGNAVMNLSTTFANLTGYALAGALTGALGVPGALLCGTGLLIGAALSLLLVREPSVARDATDAENTKDRGAWWQGVATLRANRLLMWTIGVILLLNFLLIPLDVALAPYTKSLGLGAGGFGFLSASIAVGQVLGMLLLSVHTVQRPLSWLIGGTVGIACSIGALSVAPSLVVAFALLAVAGFSAAVMNVQLNVVMQTNLPQETMGRVFGVVSACSGAVQPLGYAGAAVLLTVMPLPAIFLLIGAVLLPTALAWLQPTLRAGFAGTPAAATD